ncbi:vegetative incompatibility protein HET-E-1 [Nemania sp. FL0031]|nr:vegetative incompatibility protein HET-E-1 [Nemania sp. FL0031]
MEPSSKLGKRKRSRNPFDVLYTSPTHDSGDETEVDIIAVHGLGSDVDWAWKWKDGSKEVHWLRDPDMLPAKVPKSRIAVFNYESQWHQNAPKRRLELCGEELIQCFMSFSPGASGRPIIFIGHSLGGNVIVDALLFASREVSHSHHASEYKSLLDRIVGLVFLGTPFRGTKLQSFLKYLTSLMQPFGAYDGITRELYYDEPRLIDKLHYFCQLCNRLSMPVACFYELYNTDLGRSFGIGGLIKEYVVEEASACIPGFERYGLQADHKEINKYDSPESRSFLAVSEVINRMYTSAKDVARRRLEPHSIITNRDYALKMKPEAEVCLKDLFLTDPSEDRSALKRRKGNRASGTCEWILGTERLTQWLRPRKLDQNASNLLWLHGNPGTGKSTMAIFLTEELSQAFSTTDGRTLAYVFCDSGLETRSTATSVVRGLLLQLVQQQPQLLDYILPKYKERGAQLFKSFDALWSILIAMAADEPTGQKYCIIDALDECDKESQDTLLLQFEQTFYDQNVTPNLRILVTSRPYEEISRHLKGFGTMDLAFFPERQKDVDLFIEERVDDLSKKKNYTDKVKRQVLDVIRSKAEGTFLWVGLACAELNDVPSMDAVQVLQDIPIGLHSLYQKLFNTAVSRERVSASGIRRMLGFVAVCRRPLDLLELSEVCELHHKEDDQDTQLQFMRDEVAGCRLMVIIQDRRVHLLHQSVRDFLNKSGDSHIDMRKAHADLAYRCIDLIIETFRTKQLTHIWGYARRFWIDHARMADGAFMIMPSHAEFFTINSPCREWWLRENNSLMYYPTIRHVAASWGISAFVDHISSLDEEPKEPKEPGNRPHFHLTNSASMTPIAQAAPSRYLKFIPEMWDAGWEEPKELKELGNSAYFYLTNAANITPIAQAALLGHLKLIPKMLNAGWEEPAQLLVPAAENRIHGREFMTLLLDRLGDHATITEGVLAASVWNTGCAMELMELLSDRYNDQIIITERVLVGAVRNDRFATGLLKLLFDQYDNQITITERVLVVATRSDEVMEIILDRRSNQILTTEAVLTAAINNASNVGIVELLWDRRGDQVTITEAILIAAIETATWDIDLKGPGKPQRLEHYF